MKRISLALLLGLGFVASALAQTPQLTRQCVGTAANCVPISSSAPLPVTIPSGSGGNVGGYNTTITTTPTVAASSHSSGTSFGGLQTLAYFRTAGGSGIVNNVQWVWKTGTNLTAVTVYLFSSNPSGSTCTDAVAISIAAADVPKLVAGSPFILTPAVAGAGSSFSVGAQQMPMSTKNGESSTSLYACIAANATVTPAANDGVLTVAGLQD